MGTVDPLVLRTGETGSAFTTAPVATPKYQLPNASFDRKDTMARLGVTSIPSFATFDGNFERYKAALVGNGYIDFLLQNAVENFNEIFQVDEVLGNTYVPWLYGQRAPIFTYSGMLINTRQDEWRSAMHYLYSDVLRGTKLGERGMLARLQYDSFLVEGALVSHTQSMSAHDETAINFNFQILVKRFLDLNPPSNNVLPVTVNRPFEAILFEPASDTTLYALKSSTVVVEATSVLTDADLAPEESSATPALIALNGVKVL